MTGREREMLLAVFAVQLGCATPELVMGCAVDLLRGKRRALGDLLLEKKVLTREQVATLEGMVSRALDTQGGDPSRTLELFPSEQQQLVRAMFDAPEDGEDDVQEDHATREVQLPGRVDHSEAVCPEEPGRYAPLTGHDARQREPGRGGAGRVLAMHDEVMGRDVAMKTFDPASVEDPDDAVAQSVAVARFLREARLAGQLEHPAVVPIYEVGQRADGRHYYTMMRIRGQTLAEAVAQAAGLRERLKLVAPFLTVCQCIAHAHGRGVVHRNLTPQGITLGPFGEVYLLDWALARKLSGDDPRGKDLQLAPDITGVADNALVGTPAYMSPEQAWGLVGEINERSDVWGLGAVLYQVLTGRPPYSGATATEVVAQVRSVDPEPVETWAKGCPRELAAVCRKALQRDQTKRYENAEAMARDVEAWLKGRRVAAYRYSGMELVRRFLLKRRLWVATVSALVGASVAGAWVGLSRVQAERDRARTFARVFLDDVTLRLTPVPGVMGLVEKMSQRALAHYQRTGALETGSVEDRRSVGRAMVRLCTIQQDLGRPEAAQASCAFALDLGRRAVAEQPNAPEGLTLVTTALEATAQLQRSTGHLAAWRAGLDEALPWARRALAAGPDDLPAIESAVLVLSDLGQRALIDGDAKAARGYYEEAVTLDRRALGMDQEKDKAAIALSADLASLSMVADADHDLDEAEALALKALSTARDGLALNPRTRTNVLAVVRREVWLADLERRRGRPQETQAVLEDARGLLGRLLAAQPDDLTAQTLLVDVQAQLGAFEEAWSLIRRLEAAGSLTDVGNVAPCVAFLAGHLDEVQRLARLSWLESDPSALVYRSMASALSGRPADAVIAARALKGKLGTLQWLRGATLSRVAAGSPGNDAVRALAAGLDASMDPGAQGQADAALEAYVRALEAQLPLDGRPR